MEGSFPISSTSSTNNRHNNNSTSSDPSKYEKIPANVRYRFQILQKIGITILILLALGLLAGDGWVLRYGNENNNNNVRVRRGIRVTSSTEEETTTIVDNKNTDQARKIPNKEVPEPNVQPVDSGSVSDAWTEDSNNNANDDNTKDTKKSHTKPKSKSKVEKNNQETLKINDVIKSNMKEKHETIIQKNEARKSLATKPLNPIEGSVVWTEEDPNLCSGYFGNGYKDIEIGVPAPVSDDTDEQEYDKAYTGPLFECRRHSAIHAAFCSGRRMIMYPNRITMSKGGESLKEVMGREESIEVPTFLPGSFEVVRTGYSRVPIIPGTVETNTNPTGDTLPKGHIADLMERPDKHKVEWLRNLRIIDNIDDNTRACGTRITAPVFAVTRMEYANLFHTSTDWYNVWSVARILGYEPTYNYEDLLQPLNDGTILTTMTNAPKIPVHVLFLDGHNAGPMDEGWLAMFLSISYAKHFNGPVCFDSFVYAPFGYNAAISMGLQPRASDCRNDKHVRQFGNDMVRGLGIQPKLQSTCNDGSGKTKVLFVRRVHYLAHPRHNGQIVRRLDNEDDIMAALLSQTSGGEAGVTILNGVFSSMTMKEQVEMAQEACVMTGAHGAGLSHILFSPPGVHMLELQPPAFRRPHFISYSFWAGAHHHMWTLDSSTPSVHSVVSRVLETAQHAAIEAKGSKGDGPDHPLHME